MRIQSTLTPCCKLCQNTWRNQDQKWSSFVVIQVSLGATSFSRNVISSNRRFAGTQFCQIVVFTKQKIAESHLTEALHGRIVELVKLYDAERHFSESLFSRTSFPRIIVQPNIIFTHRRSAGRYFPETSFGRTSFCRTLFLRIVVQPDVIFPKHHLAERHFAEH